MKQSSESTYGYDEEASALLDEIDEENATVREVLRIKKLLDARHEHSENLLFESLKLLQLMELPADTIKATDITTSVKCFLEDSSERIRKFAHLLVTGWEFLLNKWMPDTREIFDLYSAREEELPFDIGDLLASQTSTFDLSNFFNGMTDEWSLSRREQKGIGKNIEVLKRSIHRPQETFIMSHRNELPSETESCLKVLPKSVEKAGKNTQLKTVKNSITKPQETLKPGGNPASTEPAKSVLLKKSTYKPSHDLKPIQVCKRASPKMEFSAREEELPFDIGDLLASQTSTIDLSNFFNGMTDEWSLSRREQKGIGKNIEVLKKSIHRPQETFMSYRNELPSETESCLKVLPKSVEKAGKNTQLKTVKNSITKPQETLKPGGNPASTEPAKSVLLEKSTYKPSHDLKPIQVCKRASPKILARVTDKPEDLTYKEKLEISKRKLRENYEDAENIKKKRRVVMIDLKSIPVQRHNQEKHKRNRGCHINKFATRLPKHNHVSLAW